MLDEVFKAQAEVSIEMHTGIFQDLTQPPTTQSVLMQSPYRNTLERSQRMKFKVVLTLGPLLPRQAFSQGAGVDLMKELSLCSHQLLSR